MLLYLFDESDILMLGLDRPKYCQQSCDFSCLSPWTLAPASALLCLEGNEETIFCGRHPPSLLVEPCSSSWVMMICQVDDGDNDFLMWSSVIMIMFTVLLMFAPPLLLLLLLPQSPRHIIRSFKQLAPKYCWKGKTQHPMIWKSHHLNTNTNITGKERALDYD